MRISDWSSDVCSSDLDGRRAPHTRAICLRQRSGFTIPGFLSWRRIDAGTRYCVRTSCSALIIERTSSGLLLKTTSFRIPMKKALLLAMMTPPPDLEEEFNEWYDTQHFPRSATVTGLEPSPRNA